MHHYVYVNLEQDRDTVYRPIQVTCAAHMQLLAHDFHGVRLNAEDAMDLLGMADPNLPIMLMRVTANKATRLLSSDEVNPDDIFGMLGTPMEKGETWAMWLHDNMLTILFLPETDFPSWLRADWQCAPREADGVLAVVERK